MEHGITRRNQLLQQQNMDALGAASSAAQLLAALKERVISQGLLMPLAIFLVISSEGVLGSLRGEEGL